MCDAFERVAPLTGRYEGVLVLIWKELIRSIFSDFTNDLPGQGAKAYAERHPPPTCIEVPPPACQCSPRRPSSNGAQVRRAHSLLSRGETATGDRRRS